MVAVYNSRDQLHYFISHALNFRIGYLRQNLNYPDSSEHNVFLGYENGELIEFFSREVPRVLGPGGLILEEYGDAAGDDTIEGRPTSRSVAGWMEAEGGMKHWTHIEDWFVLADRVGAVHQVADLGVGPAG